jgi:hypothetical protein
MDPNDWSSALGLALQYPVLLVAAALIAGFAWWLRGQWATGTIEALNQRLELAREQLADVKSKLADAETKVAAQEKEIAGLRASSAFAAGALEHATLNSIAIRRAIDSLVTSTTALDQTLSVPNVVRALSKPSATKDSG